jgi:selenocysteine lyase/cysteine desulfurase
MDKHRALGESNVAGIAALAKGFELLQRIGMAHMEQHERELLRYALDQLKPLKGVTLFGADPGHPGFGHRAGVLAFAVAGVPHNRVAQLLAQDWGIGVRNGCFCAHILLKQLLGYGKALRKGLDRVVRRMPTASRKMLPGLVRASLGLENTRADVDRLVLALGAIAQQGRRASWHHRVLAALHLAAPRLPPARAMKAYYQDVVAEVYAWAAPHPDQAAHELERGVHAALRRYSNVHRGQGQHSQVSTELFDQAREIVLQHLRLDARDYTLVFANPLRVEQLTRQLPPGSWHTCVSKELGLATGLDAIAIQTVVLSRLKPIQPGGGTVSLVSEDFVVWAEGPDVQEGGTPPVIGAIALAKALLVAAAAVAAPAAQKWQAPVDMAALFADRLNDAQGQPLQGEALRTALARQWVGTGEMVPTSQGAMAYIQFDNGASTPALAPIWDVVTRVVRQPPCVQAQVVEHARAAAAAFFNAPLHDWEHIFVANTTEAINLASWDFAQQAGDAKARDGCDTVVVNTILEHNSNELPWRALPGVELLRLQTDPAGFVHLDALESLLCAYNTQQRHGARRIRLVAVSGASNVLGSMNDLGAISAMAHRHGARFLVDGAQLTAHREVNLARDGIDYYAYSGHKMYAPFGAGGLIRKRGLASLVQNEKCL